MPISLDSSGDSPVIRISGVTPPDEGDELLALLQEHPAVAVDLAELEHMHTALLQMLIAAKVPSCFMASSTTCHWATVLSGTSLLKAI